MKPLLNNPLFTHALQVQVVALVGVENVRLKYADALDRSRTERLML